MKFIASLFLSVTIALVALAFLPATARAQTDPAQLGKAVAAIENVNAMRSQLASTLEDRSEPITPQTFQEVCKPVGMRLKQTGQENGWQMQQIASKYRNPTHAPSDRFAENALDRFANNPNLMGFWERETLNESEGTRYFRRINVGVSCLACHGAKDARPQFVKEKYLQDLAFDFQVGDLRGMYAVFIPDRVKQSMHHAWKGESKCAHHHHHHCWGDRSF
ncbi:MAG: DUF3365 domain-containing protein [Spirulina sp.]